jgi:hypothetical protein
VPLSQNFANIANECVILRDIMRENQRHPPEQSVNALLCAALLFVMSDFTTK